VITEHPESALETKTLARRRKPETFRLDDDPLWYKDALIYELHVRAFNDSDADGSGDFRGLMDKLPYLQDLGVSAVWLLPFYPSPMRDDGYDIADYTNVNPMFGTLGDANAFVKEAHRRGIRVINELVCNHTSDQHPWFQRARRARGLPLETFTCGVTPTSATRKPESSSRTSRPPTGHGTTSPTRITGTGSTRISPTSTSRTQRSRKRS
jgi:hypothetical protein